MPANDPAAYLQDPEGLPASYRRQRDVLGSAGPGFGQQGTPALSPIPDPMNARLNQLAQTNQVARGEPQQYVNGEVEQLNILGRILQALGAF